jgi:uncharacterized protein DUF6680
MKIDINWVIVLATLAGPILAVQAQKLVEKIQEGRSQRVRIFKSLMATRGALLSAEHVQALNSIVLEFRGRKFEGVIAAWMEYLDHLGLPRGNDPQLAEVWDQNRTGFLVALLSAMAKSLGYNEFNKVDLRNKIYTPIGHVEVDFELQAIRRGLLAALSGESHLSMKVDITGFPHDTELAKEQQAIRTGLVELLGGERPLRIASVVQTQAAEESHVPA